MTLSGLMKADSANMATRVTSVASGLPPKWYWGMARPGILAYISQKKGAVSLVALGCDEKGGGVKGQAFPGDS